MTTASDVRSEYRRIGGKVGNARSEYLRVYGKVKPIAASLSNVFGDGRSKHDVPLISRNPRVIFAARNPRFSIANSFDPTVLEFLREFRDVCNSTFEPRLTEDKFSTNGVHTKADNLGCVAGYMMNPMSYTALDNTEWRKSLKLAERYTDRQRKIALEVWRLIFEQWDETDVNVPKLSTSGTIRFTHDEEWKLALALMTLEPTEFERMLSCVESGDWSTLANDFEQVYMTYIQTRNQNESVSKERLVADIEYALTGGRGGSLRPADKRVSINGKTYDDLSATRARVIHAGPWAINCVLQVVASGHMKSLFTRFPDVFHVTTEAQLKSLVDGHYVYCGDVKEYDRSMSRDAIDVAHEAMAEVWDPRLAKMSKRLFESPYYARPLDMEGTRGTFVGDPRDWSQSFSCGNRSGHAFTSLIAKGNKVVDDLLVFDAMGLDVLGRVASFFRGEHVMKLINNGDDCVAYSRDERVMDLFRTVRKDPKAGHYIVEEEVGQVYSGFMLVRKDPSKLEYTPMRRLYTPFEKIYIPERSAGSRHRAFWPIGMNQRIIESDTYNENGREIWDIHNFIYRKRMAPVFGDYNAIIRDALEGLPVRFGHLNEVDRAVLEETDKIHYLYLPEEVSARVRERICSSIPYAAFKHVPANYYNGKVH